MKSKSIALIVVLLIGVIFVLMFYVKIPFSINSKGMVYPLKEWRIEKNDDGSLLNIKKDYSKNSISYYSVTEFQRGDFGEFRINESIYDKGIVKKGDTIGYIASNEEQRRFVELQGELAAQRNLYRVHSAGAKPEEIEVARERVLLAEQEYEAQKGIKKRNKILHQEEYISDEVYETSLNMYNNSLRRLNVAKAEYDAIKSGDKQQQLDYIQSNIEKLENELAQIEKRIDSFTILSPFSGVIIKQKSAQEREEAIIRLADVSQYVVVLPVELYQLEYIEEGQNIRLDVNSGIRRFVNAKVIDIDNASQMLNMRQSVFVTATIDMDQDNIQKVIPNMVVELEIDCGLVLAKEYLNRLFRTVYRN